MLARSTKSPFEYTGLSAYAKTGVTAQDAGGSHPFYDFGVRYTQSIKDAFAFKINLGHFSGTDWTADNQTHYVSPANISQSEALLSRPRDHPNYDAINVYGDEVTVPVVIDNAGTTATVNRTGINEPDSLDYEITNIKLNAGLYNMLSDSVEASYNFRFVNGDAILRHTTIYPLVNFRLYTNTLQVRSLHWFLRPILRKKMPMTPTLCWLLGLS